MRQYVAGSDDEGGSILNLAILVLSGDSTLSGKKIIFQCNGLGIGVVFQIPGFAVPDCIDSCRSTFTCNSHYDQFLVVYSDSNVARKMKTTELVPI